MSTFRFNNSRNNNNNVKSVNSDSILVLKMQEEHVEYEKAIEAYEHMAQNTVLGDVVSPITGRPFSELFKMSVDEASGKPQLQFNPNGKGQISWSRNANGIVNALRDAFGTLRYSVLRHGLHERVYDHSQIIAHNVRSEYDELSGKWNRFGWNNRRFTMENPRSQDEMGNWLSKHVEIDRLLLFLLADQQYHVTFFNDIAYTRLQRNVLNQMNTLVSVINVQSSNDAEVSKMAAQLNRNSSEETTGKALMVGNVDFRSLTGIQTLEIKMKYSSNVVTVKKDPAKGADLAYINGTLASNSLEYIKLIK